MGRGNDLLTPWGFGFESQFGVGKINLSSMARRLDVKRL